MRRGSNKGRKEEEGGDDGGGEGKGGETKAGGDGNIKIRMATGDLPSWAQGKGGSSGGGGSSSDGVKEEKNHSPPRQETRGKWADRITRGGGAMEVFGHVLMPHRGGGGSSSSGVVVVVVVVVVVTSHLKVSKNPSKQKINKFGKTYRRHKR